MAHKPPAGYGIWITGLPASGKSMVTLELKTLLQQRGEAVTVLESDVLRTLLSAKPTYDAQDRDTFYGAIAFIGNVLTDNGIHVIFDATANRRSYRERARQQIARFLEVYVDTPLEVCMERDPKGIYRDGKAGRAQHVPGLQAEYEVPINPDLTIHGDVESPQHAAQRIIALMQRDNTSFRIFTSFTP